MSSASRLKTISRTADTRRRPSDDGQRLAWPSATRLSVASAAHPPRDSRGRLVLPVVDCDAQPRCLDDRRRHAPGPRARAERRKTAAARQPRPSLAASATNERLHVQVDIADLAASPNVRTGRRPHMDAAPNSAAREGHHWEAAAGIGDLDPGRGPLHRRGQREDVGVDVVRDPRHVLTYTWGFVVDR